MPGRVVIAGAGPGSEDLVTVACLRALAEADVVIHDRLIPMGVLRMVKEGAVVIYAGKEPGRHSLEEGQIIELMVRYASEGKTVLRLHGGDPFLFGRGFEECLEVLRRGIQCTVIPGVTSAIAAPEAYLIPPVLRGVASSVAIVTGTEDPGKGRRFVDFRKLATAVDTIIVLMGASRACEIAREVIEGGRPPETPVAIVTRAYMDGQSLTLTTLSQLASCNIKVENPSVIVIGDVVGRAVEAMRLAGILTDEPKRQ